MWLIPIVGAFLLGLIAWKLWLHYIHQNFLSGIEWTLLEIIPPRDVLRSPKGMELFFTNALYQWTMKGGLEQYWQGAVWFFFSLEIVSIDGQVHFYIRTPSRLKNLIETQMYAQYPQAQIKVVEDYTLGVDKITPDSAWNLWGCEFKLEKPDPYPIRTYVNYGLEEDPKEEFKVDPISPVIELFASIEKGEQMWLQIVVRPSKKEYRDKGSWFKHHNFVKEAELEMNKVIYPYTKIETRPDGTVLKTGRPPDYLASISEGIKDKMSKLGFDTGIRLCYAAKKEVFKKDTSRNLRLMFRQYTNPLSNGLTRYNSTGANAYSSWFLLPPEKVMMLADRMLNEYRNRDFFYPPLRYKIFSKQTVFWPLKIWVKPYFHSEFFVMNVEELATMWHFPGQILKVPSLERIESKEAAPPTNLPI